MTFYNVALNEQVLNLLPSYDAVGCHWLTRERFPFIADENNPSGLPFFAGNFYWADSSYIASLGAPETSHRWCAEHWIGKGEPRVFDMNPNFPDVNNFRITF